MCHPIDLCQVSEKSTYLSRSAHDPEFRLEAALRRPETDCEGRDADGEAGNNLQGFSLRGPACEGGAGIEHVPTTAPCAKARLPEEPVRCPADRNEFSDHGPRRESECQPLVAGPEEEVVIFAAGKPVIGI